MKKTRILLTIAGFFLIVFINLSNVSAGWSDVWTYYRNFTVANTSWTVGNYSVILTINDTVGDLGEVCGIRIMNSTNHTVQWGYTGNATIESGDRIAVVINKFPVTSTEQYTIYYNNLTELSCVNTSFNASYWNLLYDEFNTNTSGINWVEKDVPADRIDWDPTNKRFNITDMDKDEEFWLYHNFSRMNGKEGLDVWELVYTVGVAAGDSGGWSSGLSEELNTQQSLSKNRSLNNWWVRDAPATWDTYFSVNTTSIWNYANHPDNTVRYLDMNKTKASANAYTMCSCAYEDSARTNDDPNMCGCTSANVFSGRTSYLLIITARDSGASDKTATGYIDDVGLRHKAVIEPTTSIGANQSAPTPPKTPTEINLYLNDTEGNQSLIFGQNSNISARINVTGLHVELTVGGTLVNNDTNYVENITNLYWFTNDTYTVTASYPGNDTYDSASATWYILVLKQPSYINLTINDTEGDVTHVYPMVINVTVVNNATGLTGSFLLRNGTNLTNPLIIQDPAGYWNYTTNFTHQNYTATNKIYYVTMLQRSVSTAILFNGTNNETRTYPNSTVNVSATINVTGLTFNLYKNGTLINTGTSYLENVTKYPFDFINFTVDYPGDANNSASSTTYWLTINKGASALSLTSSSGWSLTESQYTTLTCTAVSPLTITLTVDGVTVASPYTLQVESGTYSVYCSISDTWNYTPTSSSKGLVANPLVACTNTLTFAYNKTISTTGTFTTLNFTDLVNQHLVRENLGDVNVTGVSNVSINTTNGYFVIVNHTGVSNFVVKFGNYFVNHSYPTHWLINVTNMSTYNQTNKAILYNVLDELTGTELYPPNTTLMSIIRCSIGENYIPIGNNITNFLLASTHYIEKASLRISYTADMYYSRQFYPSESDFIVLNFYVIDAYENALDRIDFRMLDVNYYNSKLQIYKPYNATTLIITEGYFDASHYFSAYLMEDSDYYLRTINADGTTTSFGRISVVKPDEKDLGEVEYSLNPQAVLIADNILMNAYTNSDRTTLYIEYEDSLNQTNNVTVIIYFENGTVFDNTTYTTNIVNANHNITPYSDESFTVDFTVYHTTLGNSPVTYTMSLFMPVAWAIGGVGSSMYALFSLGILMFVGGITTRKSLIPGAIMFLATFLILWGIGWLAGVSSVTMLFVFTLVMIVLAIINYLKTGGE